MKRLLAAALAVIVVGCTTAAPSGTAGRPPSAPASVAGSSASSALAPTQLPPTSSPPATIAPSAPPTASPTALASVADQLEIGTYGLGSLLTDPLVAPFVFNGLMRVDPTLTPQPDLAKSCTVAVDGLSVTCVLRDAVFHDGTPVTADDVVYTFQLLMQPSCVVVTCPYTIDKVSATDAKTVVFALTQRDASFLATSLTNPIWPRHAIEASYARFAATAKSLDATRAEALATGLDNESLKARPDCAGALPPAETFARAVGMNIEAHAVFVDANGGFDACAAANDLATSLHDVAAAAKASGVEAIATSLPFLDFRFHPIGSGPWAVHSYDDGVLMLDANASFYRGAPLIGHVRVRPFGFAPAQLAAEVQAGTIDWAPLYASDVATVGRFQSLPDDPLAFFRQLKADPRVQVADYPGFQIALVTYNVRPGALLADKRLRLAIAACVDKPQLVDAATSGTALPIDSIVPSASWAFLPPQPHSRDVAAGRALIESAGWTAGSDGIYRKDGVSLGFDIEVREDAAQRVKLVDLLGLQLRDCGIDARTHPIQHSGMNDMLTKFPHTVPGTKTPFDAAFVGYITGADPSFDIFDSRQITSASPPNDPAYYGANIGGYDNPTAQALIVQGLLTSDIKERGRIYRDLQTELIADPPALDVWSPAQYDLLSSRLSDNGNPFQLTSPLWAWDPASFALSAP